MTLALRPYQRDAVDAIAAGLGDGGRGQLHAACGSGKTITGLAASLKLLPGPATFVVAVPSLSLLAQTITVWRELAGLDAVLAVCSDETVTDDSPRVEDIPAEVTTRPEVITSWLGRRQGRRLIVTTYHSARHVGDALLAARSTADLLLLDEAHHLTGDPADSTRRVLSDVTFPARRRLYMTATPRIDAARAERSGLLTMSDTAVFGPVLYEYTWARAIREGYLEDYRVVVMGVTQAEICDLLRDPDRFHVTGPGAPDIKLIAAQAVIAKAVSQFGLRRVLAFCPRIETAREFTRTLKGTLARLPGEHLPGPVHAEWVSGEMTHAQRDRVLDTLREPPANWTVVANVRCLSEGVDVPAVDAVAFTSPKSSQVDIMQAVGRALRRDKDGTGTATIIVPIVVPDSTEAISDLEPGDFNTLWHVLRALRAHDEDLGIELDATRARVETGEPPLPNKVTVQLPPGSAHTVLAQIKALVVEQTTSSWWTGYGYAHRYHERHGNVAVPSTYITDDGFKLGTWITNARQHWRKGWLRPDRVAALERIGMVLDTTAIPWRRFLGELEQFRAVHGHLKVPQAYVSPSGYALGSKVNVTRQHKSLPEWVRSALDDLGMVWNSAHASWQELVNECLVYREHHGHLDVPRPYTTPEGYRLGQRLGGKAQKARKGKLDPTELKTLQELGWSPSSARGTREQRWKAFLAACDRYVAQHGSLADVASDHVDEQGYRLGDRINYYRWLASGKSGRNLSEDRRQELDKRGMKWRVAPSRPVSPQEAEHLLTLAADVLGEEVARLLDNGVTQKSIAEALKLPCNSLNHKIRTYRETGCWVVTRQLGETVSEADIELLCSLPAPRQGEKVLELMEESTPEAIVKALGATATGLKRSVTEYRKTGRWAPPRRMISKTEAQHLRETSAPRQGGEVERLIAANVRMDSIADALGFSPSGLGKRLSAFRSTGRWPHRSSS
ncbi:Helicase associated domain protein [Streptomyces albidoflavus]